MYEIKLNQSTYTPILNTMKTLTLEYCFMSEIIGKFCKMPNADEGSRGPTTIQKSKNHKGFRLRMFQVLKKCTYVI